MFVIKLTSIRGLLFAISIIHCMLQYTGYTQKNDAVSKVNNK